MRFKMFKCDKCGECCRNLQKSDIYHELDRGDGVCYYLKGNECTIYNNRPLICRIDDYYNTYLKDVMSIDDYYDINYKSCKALKCEHK